MYGGPWHRWVARSHPATHTRGCLTFSCKEAVNPVHGGLSALVFVVLMGPQAGQRPSCESLEPLSGGGRKAFRGILNFHSTLAVQARRLVPKHRCEKNALTVSHLLAQALHKNGLELIP